MRSQYHPDTPENVTPTLTKLDKHAQEERRKKKRVEEATREEEFEKGGRSHLESFPALEYALVRKEGRRSAPAAEFVGRFPEVKTDHLQIEVGVNRKF